MDFTSLIGPAVVAAVISRLVTSIGFWINARTVRRMHSERLSFDREQAERRFAAEIGLAETKIKADLALAEKKVSLDRAFATWKRKAEFAEEVLADFYKARDLIMGARSPALFEGEGKTRARAADETERDSSTLDAYYATAERLRTAHELFAQLQARRYRFIAYFGSAQAEPYTKLHQIRHEILVSVRSLLDAYPQRQIGSNPELIRHCQQVIWGVGETDPISARLDQVVEAIEVVCGPVFREIAP
jgi:hypothetical protein